MKKKKIIIITVICVAIVAICAGIFGKKAYDKKQEELRQEQIAAKLDEIQKMADSFENAEDRTTKLETLKRVQDAYGSYQKEEGAFDECLNLYNKTIADEKQYFEDGYNSIITDNTIEDINVETDRDKLDNLVETLKAFQDSLKTEYESYSTVSDDEFEELNSDINSLIATYTDRATAILAEEEAKRQAEEEAKKKAEEEAAAKAIAEEESATKKSSSNSSNSSTSSSSKKNNASSNNNSSGSSSSSSSKTDTSSSSLSGSNNSGSSSNGSSSGSSNGHNIIKGWTEGGDGEKHYYTKDEDTGDIWEEDGTHYNTNDSGYFN